MANDCIPIEEPGRRVTCHVTADVIGKRFVDISADAQAGFATKGLAGDPLAANVGGNISVAPPSAGGKVFGVAAWDALTGKKVTVLRGNKMIVPVKSAANITAGQEVQVDATGAVIPLAAGVAVGRAVATSTSGNDAAISLY